MDRSLEELVKKFLDENGNPRKFMVPVVYPETSKVGWFLNFFFARFRINLIKLVDGDKAALMEELMRFCEYRSLDHEIINASCIYGSEFVRGEPILDESTFTFSRAKPVYWPESGINKMIIIDNLSDDTDIEILRAFLHISRRDSHGNTFYDSLPLGSGFVFIEDDNFPLKKFADISDIWFGEAKRLEY